MSLLRDFRLIRAFLISRNTCNSAGSIRQYRTDSRQAEGGKREKRFQGYRNAAPREKFTPRNPRVSSKKITQLVPTAPRRTDLESRISEPTSVKQISIESFLDEGVASCTGCGVHLQSEHPNQMGYIPPQKFIEIEKRKAALSARAGVKPQPSSIDSFSLTGISFDSGSEPAPPPAEEIINDAAQLEELLENKMVCQRCYALTHYGKVIPAGMTAEEFADIVSPIKNREALVVKLVDIFDFYGSFVPTVRKFTGTNPVILAATKADLLPSGVHYKRVVEWLHREAKRLGSTVVAVNLISAKTGMGIDELASNIEYYRRDRSDVFVMGTANAGKSTFVNALIDVFKGPKDKRPTISPMPGTTLGMIRFPIGTNAFLYDTPGIITKKQIVNYLLEDEIKLVLPIKQVNPVVHRIAPGRTIFIGGLARFDYVEGPPLVYFTFFTSNELYLHKTNTEKADELYKAKRGSMLTPPTLLNKNWPELVPKEFVIDNSNGTWDRAHVDIVLSGLGWISCTQRGTIRVRVWYPKDCDVSSREPLMPFESKRGLKPNPRFNMKPVAEKGAVDHVDDASMSYRFASVTPEGIVESAADDGKQTIA